MIKNEQTSSAVHGLFDEVPYEASYKTVEGMNSGYLTLKDVARLKGFVDSNRKVVIPKGYTVISDPYGLFWDIVKD